MKNFRSAGPGAAVWFLLFHAHFVGAQLTDVLTYHNDNQRTGQTLHEEVLNLQNVNTNHFGLLRMLPTDRQVDAEPLYVAGVAIPGVGERNLLVVATENDTVYAFDADGTNIYWRTTLLGAGEGPSLLLDECDAGIGVFGTPVIDRQAGPNGTVFVEAMSQNGLAYFQRLHALDLATGLDRMPPMAAAASFPGTGDNSVGGYVIFDPIQYKPRSSLLAEGGVIYTAWSSHCDTRPYTGWIIGFDEATLAETTILNTTPNGYAGSYWCASSLLGDTAGNLFALSGNGTFDTTLTNGFPIHGDYGNAFVKFSTSKGQVSVADYFTMDDTAWESSNDLDFGSGGALLLPDMTDANGVTRQLAVAQGKEWLFYVMDRNNMGEYNSESNADWQEVAIPAGFWTGPAYWNGSLYVGGAGDVIRAFPFQQAQVQEESSETLEAFGYPGITPSLSSMGTNDGILWAMENATPLVLHAYDATNLLDELYNSNWAGARDLSGPAAHFMTPMIASGRVYVPENTGVAVFGLLDDSTLTPLQTWRDTNFGNPSNVGAGADGADPAQDKVPNLIKYALGLNPFTPASTNQLPSATLQTNNGAEYLTLTVNRPAIAPGVTYNVEVSGDLTNWFSGGSDTVTLTNTTTQLVVRDNTPVQPSSDRFIRLTVSGP